MKFIDTAEIKVKAGDGGIGMAHFRREKFVPFGGPDGGDGGMGGDIIFIGDEGLSTLLDFRYQRHHEAECGGKGGTSNKTGKDGPPLVLRVPCGTVVTDADTSEIIGEVLAHESRILIAKGGRGGLGNTHFATSRNQAPTKIIKPEVGQTRRIVLELRMIADVGIIGAPNAGKSTIVTVISAARPKVADYPFTTLVPNLGVVSHKDAPPFVVADVPGLIPGASEGKGLGHDFLRHIERTRMLVHLVDVSQPELKNMVQDFEGILQELKLYNAELLTRPRITVLSKLDLVEEDEQASEILKQFCEYLDANNVAYVKISAASRTGIDRLLDKMVYMLSEIARENN